MCVTLHSVPLFLEPPPDNYWTASSTYSYRVSYAIQIAVLLNLICYFSWRSAWGSWGECSVTCGGGTQTRSRSCSNPPMAHGGKPCTGSSEMIKDCNMDVMCPGKPMSIPLIKVHIARKISHSKNTLIWKAFQSRVKWRFSFSDIYFCSRDIQVFLLCKFSHWWRHRLCKLRRVVWHKIKNISANNEAVLLKLDWDVAPCKIHQMIYILMLLWQHLGSSENEILSFRLNKAKYLVLSEAHASPTFITSPLKHPVQLQMVLLYSWRFSRYSASFHWLVHGHMTSNNETVSRQMPWAGNIAKAMTSNGKQFTVTRSTVHCWSHVMAGISAQFSNFAFVLFCYITNHLMTGPLGNSKFCFPRISMFPSTSSRETLRFEGNKIHCSPRDQSLSV